MSAEAFRQKIEQPHDRVIVALDNMGWGQAEEIMGEVGPHVGMAKANALAQKRGWQHAVRAIWQLGAFTMADPKYKDIPSTMNNHLKEITECLPTLVTIHADNTPAALSAAVDGRDKGKERLLRTPWDSDVGLSGGILGVTVMTSYDKEDCQSIYGDTPEKKVVQFAETAAEAGLDGIVCSPKELKAIRAISEFDDLLTVVPGITPEWAKKPDDQKRISTPTEAITDGADFLVIGRAIIKPPEDIPRDEAAQRIAQEIKEAL